MSTELASPSHSAAPPAGNGSAPGSAARRGARPRLRVAGARPGLSMLAQGEPMLWLTGGSLALCLLMIVGLLGLVLWYGLGTFWPGEVLQLRLVDGNTYLGEVTRWDTYSLSRQMLPRMPEKLANAADTLLAGRDEVTTHRRLLRTGNFELTNTHFHWVSDFEIAPEPEARTRPEWTVVVERLEWGRFYGTPQEFSLRHPRTPSAEEQTLRSLLQFFQANQYRLTETADQQQLAQALQPLEQQYERVREQAVGEFLAPRRQAGAARQQAVREDGSSVAVAEATAAGAIQHVDESWSGPEAAWEQYARWHRRVRDNVAARERLEKAERGRINARIESARLALRRQEIDHGVSLVEEASELVQLRHEIAALDRARRETEQGRDETRRRFGADSALARFAAQFAAALAEENAQQAAAPQARVRELEAELATLPEPARKALATYLQVSDQADRDTEAVVARIDELNRENARYQLRLATAQGQEKTFAVGDIVRAYPANQLGFGGRLAVYAARWNEFLRGEPREANSEGGVFPAIWGTVVMTLIMSLFVVPFGVLAALYLREYAKSGPIVSAVRISINNLAGVPSIVFGVFGLGFFCYLVGAYMDGGPANARLPVWPGASWFAALGALAVLGLSAFLLSLASLTSRYGASTPGKRAVGYGAVAAWLGCAVLFVLVMATTPYFQGWYQTHLPNPTFGKGGLVWASLTLALLTLPVVIVATEEALSAVPNSLREGSYACGAGKWQTIRRIVLPHALPGIMTGMILAMARGAGEVAPLMLVGAVKLARELPVDGHFPFLHADRSFMHLGFHIYDLGFQSQNSEAAKPMVFTTTLLLIVIVAVLNIAAVWLRSRLRTRFTSSAF